MRQLRRQASLRQADKHAERARRERMLRIASWAGVAVLLLGGAFFFLNGGDDGQQPLPTPTETTSSSSASPTSEASPGTQVGTVDPYVRPDGLRTGNAADPFQERVLAG